MKDIFMRHFDFEKCACNKEKYDVIMPYTAIHYITEGYGYFNGIRLGKGQYFCTFENKKSCWYPDRENPWSYYFVNICGSDASHELKKYKFDEEKRCGLFDFEDELRLLHDLYKIRFENGKDTEKFRQSSAYTLLSLHFEETKKPGFSEGEKLADDVKNYLDHNYHQKIKIEDIASERFLSRGYVRNAFFEKMGMSPKAYLQMVRFEAACNLLKNTNYTVAEIAKSVGYDDQLAFSKIFKKHFGLSPEAYRKNVRYQETV